jgi:hypothetical protein
MNDKQIRRLFAEVDELKARIKVLENKPDQVKEPKPVDPYVRNSAPWSRFERDIVMDYSRILIMDLARKFARHPETIVGCVVNQLKGFHV